MRPFEEGDKVRCIEDAYANGLLTKGKEYKVFAVSSVGCIQLLGASTQFWHPSRFIDAMVEPARKGDWILTVSGHAYWPIDPRADEVRLIDIAHALSLENRYGGHTYEPYSVAQHSCLVCDHLPFHLKAQGLLHDASEAYLKDIPRPIKKYLANYKQLEILNARAIGEHFNVELVHLDPQTHEADNICLFTEKRDLRPAEPRIDHAAPAYLKPWPEQIIAWPWQRAKEEFLTRAGLLGLY